MSSPQTCPVPAGYKAPTVVRGRLDCGTYPCNLNTTFEDPPRISHIHPCRQVWKQAEYMQIWSISGYIYIMLLCALGKLLPVLTTRHLSLRIGGKVYEACVHLAMLHGSEMWGPNNSELQQLCHDLLDLWHQRQRWNSHSFTTAETWHWRYYVSPSL